MPALPRWLTEPLWNQFTVLLPERPRYHPNHPLGCHRRRISDRIVFDKLLQVLRFGCSSEAIADSTCSASTIRNRRDEWIHLGIFSKLKRIALDAYDRIVGLELDRIATDGAITKAPGGGEAAGRSPVDRGKQGPKRSGMTDGYRIPLGRVLAGANHHDSPLLAPTLDRLYELGRSRLASPCTWMPDTTRTSPALCSTHVACKDRSPTRARKLPSRPPDAGRSSEPTPGKTPSIAWPAARNGEPQ
ncbi:hypothetical protein GCM10017776_55960 [Streptomyces griseoluteus]|nr:hypothetical protein GCM10017776_55960 [Streptomyces griseoluteus]